MNYIKALTNSMGMAVRLPPSQTKNDIIDTLDMATLVPEPLHQTALRYLEDLRCAIIIGADFRHYRGLEPLTQTTRNMIGTLFLKIN